MITRLHEIGTQGYIHLGSQPVSGAARPKVDHSANSQWVRGDRPGWVYMIEFGSGAGLYKIGHTKDDPDRRLARLQVGSPVRLSVVARGYHQRMRATEKTAQEVLAEFHVSGEWYHLTRTNAELVAHLIRFGEVPG